MLSFGKATLIYMAQAKKSNGSPYEVKITREIKVKEVKTFSLNYYIMGGDNQRLMRLSKNLVVPKWTTEDIIDIENNLRYELLYVDYQGLHYRVQNILKYYKMNQRMILDIEELR